jgi:Bacterial Ig domain/D-alanyl-D-alanine carboxypeptidase
VRRSTRLTGTVLACVLAAALGAPASAADSSSASPSATPEATVAPAGSTNGAPTAAPDSATVEVGNTVSIPVLANDSDPDNDTLHLVSVGDAAHGSAEIDGLNVAYTAAASYVGDDTFDYTVSDPQGATATGTVTVSVTAAPAAPENILNVTARVVALRTTSITGTVSPASPAPVTVVLQREVSGKWATVASGTATPAGTYAFSYAPTAAATLGWRTVATWTDATRVTSATHSMTVVARLDATVSGPLARTDVPYSYRAGCPVAPASLRRISMTYYDYQGRLRRGQLIVSAGSVAPLLTVFQSAFTAHFPIKKMFATDHYYKQGERSPTRSDKAAMRHGNTSAFNCRPVTGNPYRQSQHSYGNAIDINTFENPYVTSSHVYPAKARSFLNRANHRTGMLLKNGSVRTAMRRNGWPWGGRWSHPDYQHFSSNGG